MNAPLFHGPYRGINTARDESRFIAHNLRFYPDGRVVGATTYHAYVSDVARWLTYGSKSPHLSRGIYEMNGDRIHFSLTSGEGTVEYRGTIGPDGDTLALASHSLITGHRGRYTYTLRLARFRK